MSFDPVLLKFWVISVSIVSCFLLFEPFPKNLNLVQRRLKCLFTFYKISTHVSQSYVS